jgi:hypothetical protein
LAQTIGQGWPQGQAVMVGQKVTGWIEGLAVAHLFFARAFGGFGVGFWGL